MVPSIKQTLQYPFSRVERVFNYYWFLIPVWGWFVVPGYIVRIFREILRGKDLEMPPIRPFAGLFSTGFFFALLWLVITIITSALLFVPVLGRLAFVYVLFVSPILVLQYVDTGRFGQGLNIVNATKIVFTHFWDYLLMWLKLMVVILAYLVASIPIVTVIVTFPGMAFSEYYLFAEFYKEAKVQTKQAPPVVKRISKKRR